MTLCDTSQLEINNAGGTIVYNKTYIKVYFSVFVISRWC